MEKKLSARIQNTQSLSAEYAPRFYRLKNPSEKALLHTLLEQHPEILIYDEILSQAEELVKGRNPKRVYKKQELTQDAKEYLGNGPWEEYGVWVYYAWANRLVHVLDEHEFVEVRTNRNQYKITPEEKAVLSQKKIGVIGLSIGHTVAITMAMERIFGEIRLADFDVLELSNYNRIRTGLNNLNLSKVVSAAREIAEIDPFLKVTCYSQGISESNIEEFFLKDGKLDLLVEVCDGLDMKVFARKKAKEARIPVVMDTSDRGMLDVERFDLEPGRPILHGLIDHLDTSRMKGLTNEEKVPFLLPMIGFESISTRLKASMIEVEQSITTWPQLASSVVMGGGIATDVVRRILLDQFHDSGRYYLDVEELISDKDKKKIEAVPLKLNPSLSDEQMLGLIQSYKTKAYPDQLRLKEEQVKELVKAATQAPSGANSQSWKWMYKGDNLYLFLDGIYNAALLDCGNTTSLVGLGAAAENLVLKAHKLGLEVIVETPPLDFDSILVAVFKFFSPSAASVRNIAEPHICDELVEVIPNRLTNRNIGIRKEFDPEIWISLQKICKTIPGADLKIIYDEKKLHEMAEIIARMDRIRIMHQGGQQDFRAEIRWTKEEVELAKNGIDLLGTVDLTPSELAGFRLVKEWPVVKLLNDWRVGTGLEKIGRKSIRTSSAVAMVTMPQFNSENFFKGGRALERVWLYANKNNISVHPASIATLIFNTYKYGNKEILPPVMKREVEECRTQFERLFEINKDQGEVLFIRLFDAGPPKARSVRYPLEQILSIRE